MKLVIKILWPIHNDPKIYCKISMYSDTLCFRTPCTFRRRHLFFGSYVFGQISFSQFLEVLYMFSDVYQNDLQVYSCFQKNWPGIPPRTYQTCVLVGIRIITGRDESPPSPPYFAPWWKRIFFKWLLEVLSNDWIS